MKRGEACTSFALVRAGPGVRNVPDNGDPQLDNRRLKTKNQNFRINVAYYALGGDRYWKG